jgi:hypothetical protein
MSTITVEALSPPERERFAPMVERMRQLRRQSGVLAGMTLAGAVARHMIRAEEVERARWDGLAPRVSAPPAVEGEPSRAPEDLPSP